MDRKYEMECEPRWVCFSCAVTLEMLGLDEESCHRLKVHEYFESDCVFSSRLIDIFYFIFTSCDHCEVARQPAETPGTQPAHNPPKMAYCHFYTLVFKQIKQIRYKMLICEL